MHTFSWYLILEPCGLSLSILNNEIKNKVSVTNIYNVFQINRFRILSMKDTKYVSAIIGRYNAHQVSLRNTDFWDKQNTCL